MTVRSDASLLSLSALAMDKADDHLPAGAHLRWHLDPALGHPYAGFRLRRRPSPAWPWDKSEAFTAIFSKDTVATSADGIHLRYAPLRIEQAELAPDYAPRIKGQQPMRFVYEAREANDPPRQGFVRFAVLFEQVSAVGIQTFTLRGFTHHGGEKRLVAEHQERITLRVPTLRKIPTRSQPLLMISAAELHSVEFTAPPGVKVTQIRYATPELLHRHHNWETVTVLPPLCLPGAAHVAAPTNVQQLALQRLRANRPLRRPGRPEDASPGPLLTATDHSRFENRVVTEAGNLAASLSAAFQLELQQRRPPDSIMLADVANPAGAGQGRNDGDGSIDLPFYGVLQAGAFSPHIAAMLGLGHHDQRLGKQAYDYAVDAVFNQVWLSLSYLPPEVRQQVKLSALPMNLIAPQLDSVWNQEQPNFIRLIAFQPDLQAQAVAPLAAPQLKATVHADASRSPVQARVAVLAQPASPDTRLLMWRKASSIQPLSSLDAVTKLLLPALPAAEDGLCRFEDHALEAYGEVQYQAQDVDCFGRASAVAPIAADIKDNVAPPAPAQPAIHLGAGSADELLFPAARLSTDISPAQLQAAPDLAAITFMWRAGHHRADEVLSRPDGRVQAAWPPAGGSSSTVTAPVNLRVQRSDVRREVTAICVAVDAAGNVSPPSLASHAVLIDEIKPPAPQQPAEPQWTSWPDAHGETRWCVRWTLPPNAVSARVSAASESRLLALSGADRARHYSLPHAQRADALKQLAITTPNAFVPEGLAYPASVSRHDVVLPAGSDDLRVVTIEFIGKTGQKADWPDTPTAFAVVRARPSQPATAPSLDVQQDGEADVITLRSQLAGTVELFALASPGQLKALDLLQPIATLMINEDGQASHTCRRDAPGWLGYCARLRAADGRVSEPSRLFWRAARTAADAPV